MYLCTRKRIIQDNYFKVEKIMEMIGLVFVGGLVTVLAGALFVASVERLRSNF